LKDAEMTLETSATTADSTLGKPHCQDRPAVQTSSDSLLQEEYTSDLIAILRSQTNAARHALCTLEEGGPTSV
jgi:hypothetical protein